MNNEGIPGPKGRKWSDTTIRGNFAEGTGILNNSLYIGKHIWGRKKTGKDPSTGKIKVKFLPETEWLLTDVPHLAIVSQNLWMSVKAKQREIDYVSTPRTMNPLAKKRRSKYLLSGKVECECCGSRMNILRANYFLCHSHHKGSGCENKRSLHIRRLEETVLNLLQNTLLSEECVAHFLSIYEAEYAKQEEKKRTERVRIQSDIKTVNMKIEKLMNAIEAGRVTNSIIEQLQSREKEKTLLEQSLAKHLSCKPIDREIMDQYRAKVSELAKTVGNKEILHAAMNVVRPLIERIVMRPTESGWHGVLYGSLASVIGYNTSPAEGVPFYL